VEDGVQRCEVTLHGRRVVYRTAGDDGPLLLLVHGITQDSRTWERLAPHLRDDHRLLAPDLPGHGDSDNPPGDHSMGSYASILRDLLLATGALQATV